MRFYTFILILYINVVLKEHLVWHVETQTAAVLFFALAAMNVAAGDMVRGAIEAEYTATYDKFYACKEHDIAGK